MIIDILIYYVSGHGGTEEAVRKLYLGLTDKGHTVRLIQGYKPSYSDWMKSLKNVYFFAGDIPWNSDYDSYIRSYKSLTDYIGKPDLVIATLHSFLCLIAYKALNTDGTHIPIISWEHMPIDKLGNRECLSYADSHLAISKSIMNDLEKTIPDDKIHLIGNPVTIKNIMPCHRPEEGLKLLYLGRLENFQKRLDILFKGLSLVKGSWTLDIVGAGTDKKYLMELADSLKINAHINWHGWVDKPWNIITEASIMMLTSEFEGFSISVLEALSRGIPIMATKCEGTVELIKENVNGWLIEKNDYIKLSELLNSIQDGSLKLPSVQSCISSIEKYDDDSIISNIESILRNEYEKFKNRKTIDFVLFEGSDKNFNLEYIISMNKTLQKLGHRTRLFELWPSNNPILENEFSERYYYGLSSQPNADIKVYSIFYKKFLNEIGMPDIMLAPNPHLCFLCKYAIADNTRYKPIVISMISSPISSCNGKWSISYADKHIAINADIFNDLISVIDNSKINLLKNSSTTSIDEKYIKTFLKNL